jgi:hypothetical protein
VFLKNVVSKTTLPREEPIVNQEISLKPNIVGDEEAERASSTLFFLLRRNRRSPRCAG